MTDLPSREEARLTIRHLSEIRGDRCNESCTHSVAASTEEQVLELYADGTLKTYQEAIQSWKDEVRETGEFDICLEADNGDCLVKVDHICSLDWDQSRRMTRREFIDSLPVGGVRRYGTIEWMQCVILALGAATVIGEREGCHLHYANHDALIEAGNELVAALGSVPIGVALWKEQHDS